MSPRRSGDDPPLLDDRLITEQQPPQPAPPRRSPLAWMSEANPKMGGDDDKQPPSRMRPPEDQVGYLIAIVMVVIGVIFAADSGAADSHPIFAIVGTVVAAALPLAIFRLANRFVSAVGAILAAFLISLGQLHPHGGLVGLYYVLLIAALGYGFWLTRRQGKAAKLQASARGQGRAGGSRRGRDKAPEPTGPPANRRYTPPKATRSRQTRTEAAAAIAPEPSRRDRRRAAREAKDTPRDKAAKSGR